MGFLKFLDAQRARARPWALGSVWPQRFAIQAI